MSQWRFEVFNRSGFSDVHGQSVLEDIKELGISVVQAVQSAKVFLIDADFDEDFGSDSSPSPTHATAGSTKPGKSSKKEKKKNITICSTCGALINASYKFCNKCGSKL